MTVVLKAKLRGGIKYDNSVNVFVTSAPALGIYSQGETTIQAKMALEDAVKSFLATAYDRGVLNKFLINADFSPNEEYIKIEETEFKKKDYQDIFDLSIRHFLNPAVAR